MSSKSTRRGRHFSALGIAMVTVAIGQAHFAQAATNAYAVVEIGSKGVKSFSFDLDRARSEAACQQSEEARLKCIAPTTISTFDINAVEASQVELVVETVAAQVKALVEERGYANDRIFLVASSGVSTQAHFAKLKPRIEDAVTPKLELGSVTEAQEGCYGFEGILGLLPADVQARRAREALLVDIGSGNTKLGYRLSATGKCTGFGYGFGVKTSTSAVEGMDAAAAVPEGCDIAAESTNPFRGRAQTWACLEFRPGLRTLLQDNQEALNRKRVYLIGGMAWAMSNFTKPESKLKFPPVEARDFEEFAGLIERLPEPPCDFHPAKEMNKDIAERICNAFSKDQLVVGAVLLEELSLALNLKNKTAAAGPDSGVFFFRDSQFAWPLGYLRAQLGDNQ